MCIKTRFLPGEILYSYKIDARVDKDEKFRDFISDCLFRHVTGDWGDLSEQNKSENEYSLGKYLRIFSSYNYQNDEKVWIVTEADRQHTTVLFPDEYQKGELR